MQTQAIAERCAFSLDELRYEYPEEIVPAGETPASWLRRVTYRGGEDALPAGHAGESDDPSSSTNSR